MDLKGSQLSTIFSSLLGSHLLCSSLCHMMQLPLQGLTVWELWERPPADPGPSSTAATTGPLQEVRESNGNAAVRVDSNSSKSLKQISALHGGPPHVSYLEDPFPFPSLTEEPFHQFFTSGTPPAGKSTARIAGMGLTQSQGDPQYTVTQQRFCS